MEQNKEYSVKVISEGNDTDIQFYGNDVFGFYNYKSFYFDLEKLTYADLEKLTYLGVLRKG